jgi:N12 class adenine-specific DNA methylase/tRNA1(Val) A37 N6-methylase TrmN6
MATQQKIDLQYFRSNIPELAAMSDDEAVDAIHGAYYSSMNRDEVSTALGVAAPVAAAPVAQPADEAAAQTKPRGMADVVGDLGTSLWEGAKGTARSIAATGNTVTGDLKDVERYAADQHQAAKAGPMAKQALMQEIERRKQADKDPSLLSAAGNVGGAMIDNPEGAAQFVVEQAPNSIVSLGAGAAGAKAGAAAGAMIGSAVPVVGTGVGAVVGGGLGFLGGMFLGNWALETGGKAMEKAQGGFTEAERSQALSEGATKAAVIAGIDAATFGIGGKAAKVFNKAVIEAGARAEAKVLLDAGVDMTSRVAIETALANPMLRAAAQSAGKTAATQASTLRAKALTAGADLALETTGEGLGEHLGEYAATGKADIYESVMEAAAGFSQSAPEVAWNMRNASGNDLNTKGIANQVRALETQPGSGPMSKAVNTGVEAKAQRIEDGALTFTETDLLDLAKTRLDELNLKAEGTPDTKAKDDAGNDVVIPGVAPEFLSDQERQERQALAQNIDNAKALADWYGVEIAPEGALPAQEPTPPQDVPTPSPLAESLTSAPVVDLLTGPANPLAGYSLPGSLTDQGAPDVGFSTNDVVDPEAGEIIEPQTQDSSPSPQLRERSEDDLRTQLSNANSQQVKADIRAELTRRAAEAQPHQSGDVLNPNGIPFKTYMAASRANKEQPGEVVQVKGGFAIRPTQADPLAQENLQAKDTTPPVTPPQPPQTEDAQPPTAQPSEPAQQLKDDQAPVEPNFDLAKALLDEQKAATGDKKAEAAVKRKLRALAKKTPQNHEKTVMALDLAATRLGLGEGKSKPLEFAPDAQQESPTVATTEPIQADTNADNGDTNTANAETDAAIAATEATAEPAAQPVPVQTSDTGEQAAKEAKTFPQFVKAKGHKFSDLKKDSPEYTALKTEFDALAAQRQPKAPPKPPKEPAAPKAAKLKNTGADLRRYWEQLRDQETKAKSTGEQIWEKVTKGSARAAVFSPIAAEGASPGVQRMYDAIREAMPTFGDVLRESVGVFPYIPSRSRNYSDWYASAMTRSEDGAGDRVIKLAEEYTAQMAALAEHIGGASSVNEVLERIGEVFEGDPSPSYFRKRPTLKETGVSIGVGTDTSTTHLLNFKHADRINDVLHTGKLGKSILSNEAAEDSPDQKKRMVRTRIEVVSRDMPELVRSGDVTPQQMKDEFGFADVGFGNWVAGGRDKNHLNAAWDAFADLAKRLGIPRKAIGFFGQMHFTVGALGHGKYAAHFSPNQPHPDGTRVPVINLTNTKGDGTVAHEWAHAFDSIAMRSDADGLRVIRRVAAALKYSTDTTRLEELIPSGLNGDHYMTNFAYNGAKGSVQNIQALVQHYAHSKRAPTSFKTDADELGKGYWGSDAEMFARAWEAFIFDTLGGTNNYLVSDWVQDSRVSKDNGYNGRPYPVGDERKRFNAVFEAMLKSMSTKEGRLTFDYDVFDKALPDEERNYVANAQAVIDSIPQRKKDFDKAKADASAQRLSEQEAQSKAKAEDAKRAIEAELQERQRKADELAARLEQDRNVGQVGQALSANQALSDDDLNALFDQALNEVEARNAERPAVTPNVPKPKNPGVENVVKQSPATTDQRPPKVSELISQAARQGVTGIDETLEALSKLFGGNGTLRSGVGFDEETYAKAKPHFEKALEAYQSAGRTLLDLFKLLIQQFGSGVRPYLIHFAKERKLTLDLGNTSTGLQDVYTASDSAQDDRTIDSGAPAQAVREPEGQWRTQPGGQPGGRPLGGRVSGHGDSGADGRAANANHADDGLRREGGRDGGASTQLVGNRDESGTRNNPAGSDYRLTDEDFKREGSWRDTAARNLDIIALSKRIEAEGRPATAEEQALLAKYTGWGASELAQNIFPVTPRGIDKNEYPVIYPPHARPSYQELSRRAMDELTIEELREAAASTQFAHYTAAGVVRGIWSAMQRLGFDGGHMFEAGLGNGLFPMLMPDALRSKSRYLGVEKDILTARIAKLLLPQQAVRNEDFTRAKIPEGYFDAVVGNPPFANITITNDAKYKKHRFLLHDYFLVKQIDALRPGGVMAVVVSNGTMDKANDKARAYIAERADLVGAIRLPNDAFAQNAGTEVVTDVLFFKKREAGEKQGDTSWLETQYVEVEYTPKHYTSSIEVKSESGQWVTSSLYGGTKAITRFPINKYFAQHPEMVLGSHSASGTMYASGQYTVEATEGDLIDKFNAAVKRLPANVYTKPQKKTVNAKERAKVMERDLSPSVRKEGAMYLDDKGNLRVLENGSGVDAQEIAQRKNKGKGKALSDANIQWLKSYMGIKSALKESRIAQWEERDDWQDKLDALKKAYDAHVKKHGRLTAFDVRTRTSKTEKDDEGNPVVSTFKVLKNRALLALDGESTLVTSLEVEKNGQIVDAAGLSERTIKKPAEPKIESTSDALGVSLNELGHLDMTHVAELAKQSVAETIAKLGDSVYESAPGQWVMSDEYLSGDVVSKLDEASAMAATEPDRFNRNVAALLKVQPAPLAPADITVTLGAGWVSPAYIQDFASEVLGTAVDVNYESNLGTWSVTPSGRGTRNTRRDDPSDWSVAGKRSADEILSSVLNSQTIRIMTPKTKETPATLDSASTEAATAIAKRMAERFKTWVWEDSVRAIDLLDQYNSRFNRLAPRRFNGEMLTLPGLNWRIKPYPHQKAMVWRAIQTGNTYAAHAVGAGKTMEMIMSGMEQKRLGLISKPMYVVPNHMLEQFSNEFQQFYPGAEIMVADDENFHTENRRRFVAQAAINSPDAVIITHSAFSKLALSADEQKASIQVFIDELDEAIAADKDKRSITRKKLEAQRERLAKRIEAISDGEGKDKNLTFEELGVDYLFVDEAHEFRKLDFTTNRANVKGIDPMGSQKAMDLFMKVRYLERMRPGRSHFFASGTPITNTIGELYSLMRFFVPNEMADEGVSSFDAWSKQYGEVVAEAEPNAAAQLEIVERFARIVNVPELMKRFRTFADVITSDQLGELVKRPELKGGAPRMVEVEPSQALLAYMKDTLASRITTSKAWRPSPDEPSNPDPIINIITDGSLSTLDDRYFTDGEPETKGKIDRMVDNIIEDAKRFADDVFYDANGDEEPIKGSTQIVFSPIGFGAGVAKSRGFDAYEHINSRLMKEGGLARNEIAWMRDLNSDAKKEQAFADMRAGKLKVLIGSPKNMGTGVNVQKRLRKLHFLAPPWFPSDVEQPHGRILRQGNQNPEVEIDWYVRTGTYDAAKWGMVARKDRFIKQALSGDDSIRSMEDISEESQYAQAAAIASGDARQVELIKIDAEIQRLQRLKSAFHSAQSLHRSSLSREKATIEYVNAAIEIAANVAGKVADDPKNTTIKVGAQSFGNVKDAAAALLKVMDSARKYDVGANVIGEIPGLGELVARTTRTLGENQVKFELVYDGSNERVRVADEFFDAKSTTMTEIALTDDGLATRLVNVQKRVESKLSSLEARRDESMQAIDKLQAEVEKKFAQEQDLADAQKRYTELESELLAESAEANKSNTGKPDEGDGPVKFSRGESAPSGLSVKTAQGVVDVIKSAWKNAPKIVVVQDLQDAKVPERVRLYDAQQRSLGATGEPEGFWYQGKAYIVAGALSTPSDVVRVLFHEVLGHYGLRGVFGDALTPILRQISVMRRGEVRKKAAEYGLNMDVEAERLHAAEEVLVVMAQTNPQLGYVRRAVAAIRAWLRKNVPAFKDMNLSDDEIVAQYIIPAREWVVKGAVHSFPLDSALALSRTDRPVSLPDVVIGNELGAANELQEYKAAKGGDIASAVAVAKALVTDALVAKVAKAIGDSKPVIVPVVSEESSGRNKIPLAAAELLAAKLGLATSDAIGQANSPKRTNMDGLSRIFAEPEFSGEVIKGQDYLLLDDTLTQGATFASLAGHIERGGGRVVGAVALTGKQYSATIKLSEKTLELLREKHGDIEQAFQAATGYGFGALTQSEARYLTNFKPAEQIRVRILDAGREASQGRNQEAVGSGLNGPDARFSRASDATEQIKQFDVKHKIGNVLKHYLGMALQALGRRQLVDLYGTLLPQLNTYNDLVQAMDAGKNDSAAQADTLASDWAHLDKESGIKGENDRLAELMHDATLAQIDPDAAFQPGDNRLRWAGLRNKFNKLSPQAKDVYRRARSMYEVHYAEVRKAMHERIQRSDMNASQKGQMIASMDESFFKHVKGVYFPLARFGQYVILVRDENGEVINVTRAETINQAEAEQKSLRQAYAKQKDVTVSKIIKEAEFNAARDAVSKGFVADLFKVLEGRDDDNVLRDAISQLYLTSLPDLSWAKHGIHRKGTPGFSQDARRAFAQNMFHGARYLAKLKYSDQLERELSNMQDFIKAHIDDEGFDSIKAQQVLDEMHKRHDNLMSPKTNPVSTSLTSAGFVYYLGLSPAAAITNLSQTPLVALPIMGAKWGVIKSSKALLKASEDTARARNDLSRLLGDDELSAFNEAVADGTIDVTMAHDLAGISQGEDQRVYWAARPVMRAASFLFHHAERFNRQATFIACYRLARESGVSEKEAFRQAKQTTYDSHFDYSASNRPRIMQGDWAKVIWLFKQYGQNMLYTLYRQAYLSLKGASAQEKSQARKTLAGLLVTHAAAAGVLGLPVVGPLLAVASWLGGDDDDPWNAEVAMRNGIADAFGPTASDVIAHGLTRATPWDFSGRVALNNLILPDVREGLEGSDWAKEMMVAAIGPVGNIGVSLSKGLQLVTNGEYQRGFEAMLPLALRGPVKAMRYANEGNIDQRTKIVINDEVGVAGVLGQAAGFSPTDVRRATDAKWAIYQYDKARMDRRQTLLTKFAMAKMAGDNSGIRDAREEIQAFNEKNPERRITASSLAKSVRNRQMRIDKADNGIYLPRKRQDANEAGRFGG